MGQMRRTRTNLPQEWPPPERAQSVPPEPVDDVSDFEDDEDEKPKKKKPVKKAKVEDSGEKAEKNFLVETASGAEAPKKLSEKQASACSQKKFLSSAEDMEIELWGNKLTGKARSFTSGNMGWYTGGRL